MSVIGMGQRCSLTRGEAPRPLPQSRGRGGRESLFRAARNGGERRIFLSHHSGLKSGSTIRSPQTIPLHSREWRARLRGTCQSSHLSRRFAMPSPARLRLCLSAVLLVLPATLSADSLCTLCFTTYRV